MNAQELSDVANQLYDRHLMHQFAVKSGGYLTQKLFGDDDERGVDPNLRVLTRLEILKRKRELGLPTTTEEFEDLLETDRPPPNYGRGITLGAVAMGSKKPLFNLPNERSLIGGIANGIKTGKLGRIARFFG